MEMRFDRGGEMPSAPPTGEDMAAVLKGFLERLFPGAEVGVQHVEVEHVDRYLVPPDSGTRWPKTKYPTMLDALYALEPALASSGASPEGPGTLKPSDFQRWGFMPPSCGVCGHAANPATAHPRPCGQWVGSCCAEKPEAGEVFESTRDFLRYLLSHQEEDEHGCGACDGCEVAGRIRARILEIEAAGE